MTGEGGRGQSLSSRIDTAGEALAIAEISLFNIEPEFDVTAGRLRKAVNGRLFVMYAIRFVQYAQNYGLGDYGIY